MAKRLMTPEDLLRLKLVGDPQFSPDGSRLLFSVKTFGEKNKQATQLWMADLALGELEQWTWGEKGAGQGRFSPDGRFVSYLAKREGEGQIHLLPLHGGEAKPLPSLGEGDLSWHLWSPDSQWIAAAFRPVRPGWSAAEVREREEKGLSDPPEELENVWWRMDGDGVFGSARTALYLISVKTGDVTRIFAEDAMGAFSCSWLPDSSGLILAYDPRPQPWYGDPAHTLALVSLKGKVKKLKTRIPGVKGSPRVSPDGAWFAWLGDDKPDGWGVNNTKIFVTRIDRDPRSLTGHLDEDFDVSTLSDVNPLSTSDGGGSGFLEWSPDSSALYSAVGRRGAVQVVRVSLATGEITDLTGPRLCCVPSSLNRNGSQIAGVLGSGVQPFEIALFPTEPGEPALVTRLNQPLLDELALSEPQEFEVEAEDGALVHAWIMMPPGKAEGSKKGGKKRSAVLEIHGGPHTQYGWAFFHEFQVLAAEGHIVVFSNPRGSKGYGEAWCQAIKNRWGDKDWLDIKAVAEWMAQHPAIDPKRMGVMGGSYGGWMTNWVIGHTSAFAGAISDRCVSNMVSFSGTCDFPANDQEYFGGVAYGSLERIAPLWRQSPIAYFEGVKTPTLIIHSEGDLRCSIEQSEQVFAALQAQRVPSRFIRYPRSTSHGMSRGGPPDLRLHRLGEITKWWRKWLAK